MADEKIGEAYARREREDLEKWMHEEPTPEASRGLTPKPAKTEEPAKPGALSRGVEAVRQFGLGIADLPNKAADFLYPTIPPPKPQGELSFGQATKQIATEYGHKIGESMAEGTEQLATAFSGKSKPAVIGAKDKNF